MNAKELEARKQLVVEELLAKHGLGQSGSDVRRAVGEAFDRGVGDGFAMGERVVQAVYDRPALR